MTGGGPGSLHDLVVALQTLGDGGVTGLVWTDLALTVTRTFGALAQGVIVGEPLLYGVPALVGQDVRIAGLDTGAPLVLPNIAMLVDAAEMEPARVDISVYRHGDGFLVVLGRVLSAGVTERLVEDEIRKRRIADAELARINHQLEEFAYVISHDLMAPLRALRHYAGEVSDGLAAEDVDAPAVQASAEAITLNARRMGNMLQGLLEYARIGRRHEAVERVDTGLLVREVVEGLRPPDGIRIEIGGPWPVIRTVPVPLDLVIRNLIDNAIKHHDRPAGRIEVNGAADPSGLRFSVADDGPGIPPEWQEAVFEPFRRIDDRVAPDSSGIGLALVRRTIESVGGRISIVSDPARGRGTAFNVLWPAG